MEAAVAVGVYAWPFVWPWLGMLVSIAATIIHTHEEIDGSPPIWRYLRLVPAGGGWGVLGLTLLIAFAGFQISLAVRGYGAGPGLWCLPALAAIRLADCVLSHWWPWHLRLRPNPGIRTTPLYAVDAVFLLLAWQAWRT